MVHVGVLDCDVHKDFPHDVGFQYYGDCVQAWLSESAGGDPADDDWTCAHTSSNIHCTICGHTSNQPRFVAVRQPAEPQSSQPDPLGSLARPEHKLLRPIASF